MLNRSIIRLLCRMMAEDAVKCFTSLLESVPSWIAELEQILKTVTDRQAEILFENQPADAEPDFAKTTSKRPSLKSGTSGDEGTKSKNENISNSLPDLLRPQLPHMTDSDALRLSQRKRKTASVCSGNQSNPCKYRSRSMIVVYYDGEAQKSFESLVRAIGTCRNNIRKGKMGVRVDCLARTGSSSSEGSNSGDEDAVLDLNKLGYRSTRQTRTEGRMFGKDVILESFDKVDNCLEKGQTLCERAAHQILRDGDCALEVRNAKAHFLEAKKLAEADLPELRRRAERAVERQRRSDERRRAEAGERTQKELADALNGDGFTALAPSLSTDGKLEVDLEADDSDADENDFAVDALRFGKYNMRSTRLVAH